MKRLLFAATFIISLFMNAQTTEEAATSERKNDIMLDPILLIAIPVINFNYERLLNENSGVGVNALIYLGDSDDEDLFSQFSPYYRMYFGKKYASGFFVEGFVPIMSSRYTRHSDIYYDGNSYYQNSEEIRETNVGAGIGFGGKWLTKKNIVFELSGGIARIFGSDDKELTGRYMMGIGYRF